MTHGKAHTRFQRFLAKKHRSLLKKFRELELPKDVLLHKFKEHKQRLIGS